MNWDFRIFKRKVRGVEVFEIHRVFYLDELKQKPAYVETAPAQIVGHSGLILLEEIDRMVDAFERPVFFAPSWNIEVK